MSDWIKTETARRQGVRAFALLCLRNLPETGLRTVFDDGYICTEKMKRRNVKTKCKDEMKNVMN